MTSIVIPYTPRPLQKQVHRDLDRFSVIVCHRRWGKTVFAVNELIKTALTCNHPNPRVAYVCPLYKQAKSVAWDYAKHYSQVIPGVAFNEAELRVDYPNGGRLQLFGADNADALRGIYLDGLVLDEYAQMNQRAWSEVLRPALSDREGWAIFIGTPQGHNAFYERYRDAENLPGWMRSMYKASETNILKQGELEAARREMSADEYAQEYECSWTAAIRGAYYATEMAAAEDEGRISGVPYDDAHKVITAWDLGISDSTVIWYVQRVGQEIHVIDCDEYQGIGLPEIIKRMEAKPYSYLQHIAPHDIKVRELGSGKSRMEIAASLGVKFDVAPNQSVADGISSVRNLINRAWFDRQKCSTGIEALMQYRVDFDEKRQVFRSAPRHDWTSHFADAFRMLAVTKLKTPIGRQYRHVNRTVQGSVYA